MSTRTPLNVTSQRTRTPGMSKGGKMNENNVDRTVPSYLKPTMSSSTKTAPSVAKQPLTSKSSRPALAALAKPQINSTPKPKTTGAAGKDRKPQPLGIKTPGIFKQPAPVLKTPAPAQKVAPKSTKKTISVYTPAREVLEKEEPAEEVEHTHPRPPPLSDGPDSPMRRILDGEADYFAPAGPGVDFDDFDIEPPAPLVDQSLPALHSP